MSESFYDEEIAPVLKVLMEKCKANGCSFLAVVEYAPESVGITIDEQPTAGAIFRVARMASRAKGNVDALYMALKKYGDEHGHNSVVLNML